MSKMKLTYQSHRYAFNDAQSDTLFNMGKSSCFQAKCVFPIYLIYSLASFQNTVKSQL